MDIIPRFITRGFGPYKMDVAANYFAPTNTIATTKEACFNREPVFTTGYSIGFHIAVQFFKGF